MERILTKEEIKEVLSFDMNNPIFRYQGLRLYTTNDHSFKTVIALSNKYSLILIHGNEDTGEQHIRERHGYWSTNLYTILNEKGNKVFQNQSKFPMNICSADYLKIADLIYSENRPIINDKKGELFEVYEKELTFGTKKEKTRLILYKDTKIIHTMYLTSNKYAKKKVKSFPFLRAKVKIRNIEEEGIHEIYIPYVDVNRELKYGILIHQHVKKDLEEIFILAFDKKDKQDYLKRRISQNRITKFDKNKSEQITYQHCDLRIIERIILSTDDDIRNGTIRID